MPAVAGLAFAQAASARQAGLIRLEKCQAGNAGLDADQDADRPGDEVPLPVGRGVLLALQRAGGGTDQLFVSTDPPSPFRIDIFRTGYYGAHGRAQVHSIAGLKGMKESDPPVGERRLRECRWEPAATITHSRRLAQRRLRRQGHGRARRAPELRHFHRPRRPGRGLHLPVLRHHLASRTTVGPASSRCTTTARTPGIGGRGPTSASTDPTANTARSWTSRCRTGSGEWFLWSSRSPTGWSSTATT